MPHADSQARKEYQLRYSQENRDVIGARAKAWVIANPERTKAAQKAWREQNAEKVRDYAREWYLANRETVIYRVREREQRLLAENPVKVRAKQRDTAARRRARLRAATVERVDLLAVWERDGGVCGICGELADPTDWHLDHVIPIARGGEHSYANVQVSHPRCNWRKAAA